MSRYDGFTDEELLEMMRNGEEGVSDYLMEKYKHLVRKKARAMYLIGGDTDDLIQEGMIGLFRAVMDYRPEKASFMTFASLCIDRQLYNAVQSAKRQKHLPLNSYVSINDEEYEKYMDQLWAENPESIIIDRENTQALEKEIAHILSPLENRVLESYLQGDSYVEIGERLGKNYKSIDNALHRIRRKIRECMEKYGKKI